MALLQTEDVCPWSQTRGAANRAREAKHNTPCSERLRASSPPARLRWSNPVPERDAAGKAIAFENFLCTCLPM